MDLEKINTANVILDKFNLMNLILADESLEIAKFLADDGSSMYESIPFSALAKEAKNNDYKKIVNLMGKMTR